VFATDFTPLEIHFMCMSTMILDAKL